LKALDRWLASTKTRRKSHPMPLGSKTSCLAALARAGAFFFVNPLGIPNPRRGMESPFLFKELSMSMTNTNARNASNSTQGNNFVDMHTVGLGYLSRVREVPVRKGKPFMSASISAFHGEKGVQDGLTYVPFDVKAASEQCKEVLKQFEAQANDRDCKVMVRFKIGDQYIDSFTFTKGDRAGQTGMQLKGRLLFVSHVWVKAKGQDSYALAYEYQAPAEAAGDAGDEGRDGTNG
jgi:hypothetical protein